VDQRANHDGLRKLLETDAQLSARLAVPDGLPRWLSIIVAHSGDSPLWLAAGTSALLWGIPFWKALGLRVLLANLIGSAVSAGLKFLFRRTRPPGPPSGLYARFDQHAFPSGHATRLGCMIATLVPVLPPWAAGLLVIWSLLVGLLRVALQIHYLLDIIAGMAIGGLIGVVLLITLF
jgi:undecaprenyl-diphosphatase